MLSSSTALATAVRASWTGCTVSRAKRPPMLSGERSWCGCGGCVGIEARDRATIDRDDRLAARRRIRAGSCAVLPAHCRGRLRHGRSGPRDGEDDGLRDVGDRLRIFESHGERSSTRAVQMATHDFVRTCIFLWLPLGRCALPHVAHGRSTRGGCCTRNNIPIEFQP